MFLSLFLIMFLGLLSGSIMKSLKLPSLMGMIILGIIIGPSILNLLDPLILDSSVYLRQIALVIIISRAGLNLDLSDVKKVGKEALFLSFVPATLEIIGITIFAPVIFGISYLEAAIMGSVLAAVSPAVIVPRMLQIIEEKFGVEKGLPQLVLAGAALDDIFVIVIFTSLTSIALGKSFSLMSIINIPLSIISGGLIGFILASLLSKLFKNFELNCTRRIILMFGISFLLLEIEKILPISALIAIMFIGISLKKCDGKSAEVISKSYTKLWIIGEIFLFVLLGSAVKVDYLYESSIQALILIMIALVFRSLGVYISILKSNFSFREKIFVIISYLPKATVQAAIGGLPLALGLECGNVVLTVAIVSILFTAPMGAFLIEKNYKKLLIKN